MSKHIEMRRGPQETKTVLFDSADIKPIYYPLLSVLRSHLLTFPPYFFISFNYLHSLYSSTDFNALQPLDSFYSEKQQRIDRIYYLIQTVLPVDKNKRNLWSIVQLEKKGSVETKMVFSRTLFSDTTIFRGFFVLSSRRIF